MRYIRTKDTIFEVVEETELVYRVRAKGNPNNIYSKSKCATDVIKSGDTIEELCDEFVIIDAIKNHIVVRKDNEVEQHWLKYHDTDYVVVYGAIWTDKGLIYVAKYVEGELVLL